MLGEFVRINGVGWDGLTEVGMVREVRWRGECCAFTNVGGGRVEERGIEGVAMVGIVRAKGLREGWWMSRGLGRGMGKGGVGLWNRVGM